MFRCWWFPPEAATRQVVSETVSLRDLAATVVDVVDQGAGSPFPGHSLARFWNLTSAAAIFHDASPGSALAKLILPSIPSSRDSSGLPRTSWPRAGLTPGEWSYIRHEGDGREELFHLRRGRQGAAKPGQRSRHRADARSDAGSPRSNHGRTALADAV